LQAAANLPIYPFWEGKLEDFEDIFKELISVRDPSSTESRGMRTGQINFLFAERSEASI
jgi:hypothetical protein